MDAYSKLTKAAGDLGSILYGASFDTPDDVAGEMCGAAESLLDYVLSRHGLTYFNPGEPCATREDPYINMPLTSDNAGINGGLRTWEEEQAELQAGEPLGSEWLYWGRLRLRQAQDVLEDGWQYGLGEDSEDDGIMPEDDEDELKALLQEIREFEEDA